MFHHWMDFMRSPPIWDGHDEPNMKSIKPWPQKAMIRQTFNMLRYLNKSLLSFYIALHNHGPNINDFWIFMVLVPPCSEQRA
jgi:hypothetical protein